MKFESLKLRPTWMWSNYFVQGSQSIALNSSTHALDLSCALCDRSDMICTISKPLNVCRKREHLWKKKAPTFHGRIQANRQIFSKHPHIWLDISEKKIKELAFRTNEFSFLLLIVQSFLWHVRIFASLHMHTHRIKNCRHFYSPPPVDVFFFLLLILRSREHTLSLDSRLHFVIHHQNGVIFRMRDFEYYLYWVNKFINLQSI